MDLAIFDENATKSIGVEQVYAKLFEKLNVQCMAIAIAIVKVTGASKLNNNLR